jgi:hypothetical protein
MTKGKDNKKKKGTETGKTLSEYKSSGKGNHSQSTIAAFVPKQGTKPGKGK